MHYLWLIIPFLLLLPLSVDVFAQSSSSGPDTVKLDVQAEPNILFLSGGGDYKVGTVVTLEKAPEVWREYKFVGWKVDGKWTNENPLVIRMDKYHEVRAVYEKETVIKVKIDSVPRVSEVTVDDKIYLPSELPVTLEWSEASTHTISVKDTINESVNKRYVFDVWKDSSEGPTRTIKATSKTTEVIALFKTQHYFKAITEYGNANGAGWYDSGSVVDFSIQNEVQIDKNDEGIRYVFDSWDTGDYRNSPQNSVPIDISSSAKANWKKEYKLEIKSNVPDYVPAGGGFFPVGKSVALLAEPELKSPNSDTKYVFSKWVSIGANPVLVSNAMSPATSIVVDQPYVVEARYKKSFLVNAWTPYGTTSGKGFYDEGAVAEIKLLQNEMIVDPGKEKKVFSHWDTKGAGIMNFASSEDSRKALGDSRPTNSNIMIIVTQPTNVTANWKSQYYLDVKTTEGTTSGSGWYTPGSQVTISAKPPTSAAGMWTGVSFAGWSGDIDSTSPNAKILVSKPSSVVAEWKEDITPGIINAVILGGIGIAGFVIYTKTKKNIGFGFSNLKGSKKFQYLGDRRGLDSFIKTKKQKSQSQTQPLKTYDMTSPLPKKKSGFMDWLMGRDS